MPVGVRAGMRDEVLALLLPAGAGILLWAAAADMDALACADDGRTLDLGTAVSLRSTTGSSSSSSS